MSLFDLFKKKKTCAFCSNEGSDVMGNLSSGENLTKVCRQHLIEQFKKHFLNYAHQMVVSEFQPENTPTQYTQYYFTPLTSLKESLPEGSKIVEVLLSKLENTNCQKCGNTATVMFVPAIASPVSKEQPMTYPEETFITSAEPLCKGCTLISLTEPMKNTSRSISVGIPYSGDGYYQTGWE